MGRYFNFPILAVILVLLWPSFALAQLSDGANGEEENSAASLEQLRILALKGDRDAQHQLADPE